MESTRNHDESWLRVVREAFAQTDGSSQQMSLVLRARLSTHPAGLLVAEALVEGLTELVRYADQPVSTQDAVDLESESVAAAQRVIRTLLHAVGAHAV